MADRHVQRSPVRRLVVLVAAATTTVVLAGCELPRFGAPDAASEEGGEVVRLWSGFFVAAVAVAMLIWVLLAIVLIRFRRRAGDDEVPSQKAANIPLEVAYTLVPILIVGVLFAFSVRTEGRVTKVAEDPTVEVQVIGFQWSWQFRYAEGFTIEAEPGEAPELVLPVGEPTNLDLVSRDVNHSFWVPDFLSKRDLIRGVDNEITVTPTRTGTYVGRCAEFCGLDHWRMSFSVRVVPLDEYRAWAAEQEAGG